MIGCLFSSATLSNVFPHRHFSLPRPGGIIILFGKSVSSLFILLLLTLSSFDGGYSKFCLNTFASAPLKFSGFNKFNFFDLAFGATFPSRVASSSIRSVSTLVFLFKFSLSAKRLLSRFFTFVSSSLARLMMTK